MEGRPGHYGIKQTAEQLFPDIKLNTRNYGEKINSRYLLTKRNDY